MQVGLGFLLGQGVLLFLSLILPLLDDVDPACWRARLLCCCKMFVFSSLARGDDSVPFIWKTQRAAVPIAAVVLEHSPCARDITINQGSNNPPLATMAAQSMMDMLSQKLACVVKPAE